MHYFFPKNLKKFPKCNHLFHIRDAKKFMFLWLRAYINYINEVVKSKIVLYLSRRQVLFSLYAGVLIEPVG